MSSALTTLTLVDHHTGTVVSPGIVLDLKVFGSGPAILLLHGAEGSEGNKELIQALALDHTVYVPTHPGFGLSPMPTWFRGVDDIAYTYLNLLDQLNLRNVHLVGLQFGAWVAAELAIRDCSRLGQLTLVNPIGIKVGAPTEREILDVFATARELVDAARFAAPDKNPLRDLKSADLSDVLLLSRNEEALATYAWEPYMHNPRLKYWLSRISIPCIVVRGEQDGIVGPDYAQAFVDYIPKSSLVLVPDAGHCAQIDRPTDIAELVRG
ncbi:alpha/beta hydrolase [Cryobacterium sp. Hh7]|uniref:alpha/beta fold hydrolase n=1 Tax=Cryobacterium sp. Hh7 TaxID=1259159 RepID=UPI00106C170D|nr:alpha/beta hydrolase [Cryobacterium sp. Hh7]TFD56973.1 alpha/beta hydrolase [Cryobacterium sp. Hh7]